MKKIISFPLLSFLLSAPIFAADTSKVSSNDELNVIYITRGISEVDTNEETPTVVSAAHTEIITRKEIERSGAVNVSDVLRSRGGVIVSDPFGDGNATIDVRGFGESAGSNTLILVDGRRLNNTDIAIPSLNSVSLNNVERIEIIKGSAGSLYGDQAVGGVINIITKKVTGFDGSIGTTVGSYDRRSVNFGLSDKLTDQFSYRVFGEKLKADNYRDNNESKSDHFFGNIAFDNGSTKWFAEWQFDDERQQLPGSLVAGEVANDPRQSIDSFMNDFQDRQEKTSRIGIDQRITDHWTFLAEYTRRREENSFVNNFRGCVFELSDPPNPSEFLCSTVLNETDRDQDTFNPRVVGDFSNRYGKVIITLGGDFTNTDYRANIPGAFISRSNEQDIDSYYAQAIIPIAPSTQLTLGGRHAKVKNQLVDQGAFPTGQILSDSVSVFNVGLSKEINYYRLFARYDENFRFAKVDEQVFTEDGTIGLNTQEGKSKEIGFEYAKGNNRFSVLGYRLELSDEIAFDPAVNGPFGPFGANVNFDSTLREGVVFEFGTQLTNKLGVDLAYSILNSEFKSGSFAGNTVSGAPNKIIRAAADYKLSQRWNLYLEAQHNGNQYRSGDNSNDSTLGKQGGYTVANLSVNYRATNWSVNGRVNNLTDKSYSESTNAFGSVNPSPERNVVVSVKYDFD